MGGSFDSPYLAAVKKHEESRGALYPVAVGKFLVYRSIDSKDGLFEFHHLCHLLDNRFEFAAVSASVGHELNYDWTISLPTPPS